MQRRLLLTKRTRRWTYSALLYFFVNFWHTHPSPIFGWRDLWISPYCYCYYTVIPTYDRRDKVADLVPVDVPINLAIVAAAKIASEPSNAIPVYNCTSGSSNPITWGQLETMGWVALRKYPMENVLWYPGGSYKESAALNAVCQVR